MIASKVQLNEKQLAATRVNTMHKTVRRKHLKGELRERVVEQILSYVSNHPGHSVPATSIAKAFGLTPAQVSQVLYRLVSEGRVDRITDQTYRLPQLQTELPTDEPSEEVVEQTLEEVAESRLHDAIEQALPQDTQKNGYAVPSVTYSELESQAIRFRFYMPEGSLQEFVAWLVNGARPLI